MAGEALSRPDGRAGNQIRPLVCTRSLLSRADGSAQWSQENTTVLAAVYGPKSVTGKKENPEYASLEVIWKPKSGLSGKFEKEAELIVKRSLESIILAALYPNLGISIILQVINDDGSLLACAMNAACAALVDAGMPLSGLIAAVSCGVTVNNEVVLDLLKSEEQKNVAHVCLVFPSQPVSVVLELPSNVDEKPEKEGFITCVMRGAMDGSQCRDCQIFTKKLGAIPGWGLRWGACNSSSRQFFCQRTVLDIFVCLNHEPILNIFFLTWTESPSSVYTMFHNSKLINHHLSKQQ